METIASDEELRQECIDRMNLLKLDEEIVKEFTDTGYIHIQEEGKIPQKADKELMEIIEGYGNRKEVKVYYIYVSHKEGNIYNWDFYCVSNFKDNWEEERKKATEGNFDKIHREWTIDEENEDEEEKEMLENGEAEK